MGESVSDVASLSIRWNQINVNSILNNFSAKQFSDWQAEGIAFNPLSSGLTRRYVGSHSPEIPTNSPKHPFGYTMHFTDIFDSKKEGIVQKLDPLRHLHFFFSNASIFVDFWYD